MSEKWRISLPCLVEPWKFAFPDFNNKEAFYAVMGLHREARDVSAERDVCPSILIAGYLVFVDYVGDYDDDNPLPFAFTVSRVIPGKDGDLNLPHFELLLGTNCLSILLPTVRALIDQPTCSV